MKVDEKLVKISLSKIPVDFNLELGQDITILVNATVVKVAHEDNNDSTYDEVYTVKGVTAEVIKD